MKKSMNYVLILITSLSMTSCATILTGSKDSITFNSQPEGAKVVFQGTEKCVTPCTTEIQRSLGKRSVEIKKEGYETKELKLEKTFNPVTLVNILLGGVIGIGIDLGTGSFLKYDPKVYNAELTEK
ncbi:MAG: PEGA domain-containing protein [Bergeyella sp.]